MSMWCLTCMSDASDMERKLCSWVKLRAYHVHKKLPSWCDLRGGRGNMYTDFSLHFANRRSSNGSRLSSHVILRSCFLVFEKEKIVAAAVLLAFFFSFLLCCWSWQLLLVETIIKLLLTTTLVLMLHGMSVFSFIFSLLGMS